MPNEGRHTKSVKITRSASNIFRDLGFDPDETEHLRIRADLMIEVQKRIAAGGRRQTEVAKLLRITQPRVSDLLRGRIDLFSTDVLIDMLARLGVRVRLVLRPSRVARGSREQPVVPTLPEQCCSCIPR